MNIPDQWYHATEDPLGLRQLEQIEPQYDGWKDIQSTLQNHQESQRRRRYTGGWLALAASLMLAIGLTVSQQPTSTQLPNAATSVPGLASVSGEDHVSALIGLSQNMEEQVKNLRQESGSMPAESAVYVAELEDLIAQVDSELSLQPDSINLWGQRVNLLLDLAQIYQQQWEIDYGRMASL